MSALVLLGSLVGAGTASADDVVTPGRTCASLAGTYDLPGATTHVTSATVVAATATAPENCDVHGYVDPSVGFELSLPTKTYAGRYLQLGCGGFCGGITPASFPDCGFTHGGDVAVAATDDGHEGSEFDGTWGKDNQAARDDFAFRAPHVVSRASKQLIQTFYGGFPRESYFGGCSDGGREALLLAQRYPDDFNGIIAGAPAVDWAPLAVFQAWVAKVNTGPDGNPIFTLAKLAPLHAAVLAACDKLDGLADGQIDDPRACHFDPATLTCPAGTDTPACLTPAQVTAVRKLYAPPSDDHGRLLYPGGEPFGSELAWAQVIVPDAGDVSLAATLADNYFRYLGYPIGTPASSLADFTFTTQDFARLIPEGVRSDAMSPDLSAFRRAGGKIVLWQGWADQAVVPTSTLDYYQRLTDRSGGPARTQQFARLFMIPSMYHCAGGDTLTEFDPLRQLVAWVEHGTAPDRVIATGRDETGAVTRTRPVFPYPAVTRYRGTGSIDDAANFGPAAPASPPRDVVHWAGDPLYDLPGPVAR